jgi:dethiobiotin synthetase
MNGYFISGTDTGIGKTLIAAMLLLATRGRYWKPVQSGNEGGTDTETVRKLTGLADEHFEGESYTLEQPLSPHLASRLDKIRIETGKIIADFDEYKTRGQRIIRSEAINNYSYSPNFLIIEGAGGLMVPLNEKNLIIDLIKKLGFPVVLVSRSTLGTINHTLLSLEALKSRKIPIAGIVMSGPENTENRIAIETYGRVKVLAEIPVLGDLVKADLMHYGNRIAESLRELE